MADLHLVSFPYRTLSCNSKTRPGCFLPDYEIKENKVGFRGRWYSTKVENGEKEGFKERYIPVDCIFGG